MAPDTFLRSRGGDYFIAEKDGEFIAEKDGETFVAEDFVAVLRLVALVALVADRGWEWLPSDEETTRLSGASAGSEECRSTTDT